jgi:hypothetical protein
VEKDRAEWVVVYRSAGHLGAEVARSKLEAAGIPAVLSFGSGSTVWALTIDGLGEVRVLVPPALAEEARTLLEESEEPVPDEPEGESCAGDAAP